MHYRIFRVRAIDPDADIAALNAYLASHPVLSVDRQLIDAGANSFWSFCVAVADAGTSASVDDKTGKRPRIDYREVLSPEHFTIYDRLRTLRNRLAEQQGCAPYAIFTNEQLAAMAKLPKPSKEALASIEGIGDKRLAQYADQFLAELKAGDDAAH
ncbi:MAG: HRDC domain-containing protein [Thiohalocapsa sp. PB-PSB1]|jgi:superfamily II DNA helicase RecQ|nr:MAG: hypothetical protein N838_12405 [Thiohalocapsa sp. PB-PSB1]QQO52079.1 MAG: HRDC domain-containing protein [Thiohalocapsa sp. PB-PSB1]HCS88675.1 hypothetical protein [Chromatiaceae bacterium]